MAGNQPKQHPPIHQAARDQRQLALHTNAVAAVLLSRDTGWRCDLSNFGVYHKENGGIRPRSLSHWPNGLRRVFSLNTSHKTRQHVPCFVCFVLSHTSETREQAHTGSSSTALAAALI